MNWYLKVLKQYTDFSGRARRTEYWMFVLFNIIALIVAILLDNLLGTTFGDGVPYGWLYILYALFVFIPSIAVGVRRLHDTDKSGWWYLMAFIPIGNIVLLVFFCLDSVPGRNKWGENPKGIGNDSSIDSIGTE